MFIALLSANVAHAKPKAKAKAKGAFVCALAEVQMIEVPDFGQELELYVVVRVKCSNKSGRAVRITSNEVTLITGEGRGYAPQKKRATFDSYYSTQDSSPVFVGRFLDIEPGTGADFGFSFKGGSGLSDPDLWLDMNGEQYEYHRPPNTNE